MFIEDPYPMYPVKKVGPTPPIMPIQLTQPKQYPDNTQILTLLQEILVQLRKINAKL